jgi:hypothetical protein
VSRLPRQASADAVDLRAIVQAAPASEPYGSALARAGCEPESDEPRLNKCFDEVPRLRYRFDYQKARAVAAALECRSLKEYASDVAHERNRRRHRRRGR